MKQPYNTALYMRLSRDDENYGDSVSIETQRTILQQYAKEQELHVVGYYLEYEFPEKQVRYIAVSENEDTKKGLSDFVPFKNLFNEWFAKDTSRKVKTALHAKFAAGERTFAYAPLGYIRHPEVKNAIVIDVETCWIIEKIFDLAYHGAGAAKIERVLVEEHVPTAGWLNYQHYGTFAHIYEGQPEEKSYARTLAQVKSILKDETYIGNSVHNKQSNISYKNKTYSHYTCSQYGQGLRQCSAHYIRYDFLYHYVLTRIQDLSRQAQLDEKELLHRLLKGSEQELAANAKRQSAELTEKIERLSAELESEKQTTVDTETWISLLKQYSNPTELTAELLNTLIEKIVIHEATTVDGMGEQNIDIYYRLIGKIV